MGFPDDLLLTAAGYAQMAAGNSSASFNNSNYDDPYDQLCILVGINYARGF
ncbi:MAG: hypothetical protein IJB70_04825 [Clostridia bacterium]|nr:hypothetical protein [Clostridia bacterium]